VHDREKVYLYIYIYIYLFARAATTVTRHRGYYIPWSAAFNRSPTLSSTAVTARALTARPPSFDHPPCPIRPPSVCVRDAAWSTNNNRRGRRSILDRPCTYDGVHYMRDVCAICAPLHTIRAPPLRQRQSEINLFEPLLSLIYVYRNSETHKVPPESAVLFSSSTFFESIPTTSLNYNIL